MNYAERLSRTGYTSYENIRDVGDISILYTDLGYSILEIVYTSDRLEAANILAVEVVKVDVFYF